MAAVFIEAHTVASEDVTVSSMVWRRYHRAMPGMVERIYDMNVGLADLGAVLPLGTVVRIPIDAPREPEILDPIVLW